MPSYDYSCDACGFKFRISHSITNKLTDCVECSVTGSLIRYTESSNFTTFFDKSENRNVGEVVKESIEQFKSDLEDQKKETINRNFDG
tara:strand:+ start:2673 stop:2936 length:264 start_codon:yes stop_codon:yes gene_type:complete